MKDWEGNVGLQFVGRLSWISASATHMELFSLQQGERSLVQWLQVLILCGEDVGSNPAGKLFTPQKLSIHIPNPSLPPSLRRRRGQIPSKILQTFH